MTANRVDYGSDPTSIANLLSNEAVTLRILVGSREADYVSAYFPISIFPTLVVIHNGQLVAQLHADLDFSTFKNSVIAALSQRPQSKVDGESGQPTLHENGQPVIREGNSQSRNEPSVAPSFKDSNSQSIIPDTQISSGSHPPRPVPSQPSLNATNSLQQVMEDRRKRLQADKAAKDAAERAKRKAVSEARREAANAASGNAISKQASYAQEQRKRQKEAKEEKQRILHAIQIDKAERKEKETQRSALAEADRTASVAAKQASKSIDQTSPKFEGPTTFSEQCSLQVRLVDGTTLRKRFPTHQTLNNDIRPWIAEQRTDGDMPYILKQILTPQANRTISISEEKESLQSLGLSPSATLVMVPIPGYVNAYVGDQGAVGKASSVVYYAASAGGSIVKGVMETLLGFGRAAQDTQVNGINPRNDRQTGVITREGVPFQTLNQGSDGTEDHHLYNGNQVMRKHS
ncbi:MAG: hypothetical protein Q9219_007688 [cf. Caloplaca sp. 3 TL-2023]